MGPSPAHSVSKARQDSPILELGEIVPELPAHHKRSDTTDTDQSSVSFKQDDLLLEEGVGTAALEREVRQSRRARSSSWMQKWSGTRGEGSQTSSRSFGDGSGSVSPNGTTKGEGAQTREGVLLAPVGPYQRKFDDWLLRLRGRHEKLGKTLIWIRGPSPAHIKTIMSPFPLPFFGPLLFRIERWCTTRLKPLERRRQFTTPIFLLAWLLALIFLVRASFYNSSTNVGEPDWLVSTSTFWTRNDGCGINGSSCEPFDDFSYIFRCPGQTIDTKLLNERTIGNEQVIFQPLVVGGNDPEGTYRADSWVCAAAIHQGLFGNQRGGCGELQFIGEYANFEGGRKNGVDSVGFPSTFPSSFRFVDSVKQGSCKDLRNDILGFDVAMSVIFSFLIRPAPQAFFWGLFVFGFWHVVLVSDPRSMPPDISTGFKFFLPALFVGESFYRHCWRFVGPAFENSGFIIERTVWYLAGFWVGTLSNVSLGWIPINRLTPSDIKKEPGGLVAVIVLAAFLFFAILNQIRVIRRTGWLFFYLKWYAVGGIVIAILASLPGFVFRLHHYFAAICLMPGTAFVTRPSAIFQGFLVGLFLQGAARWGFDSILETVEQLVGDGTFGTSLPVFLTNSTTFAAAATQGVISWMTIEEAGVTSEGWDGYSLLVDDVVAQTGSATNFSIAALNATLPHFFRLAYTKAGTSGDFTKAATAFLSNTTWFDPAAGAT